MTLGPPWLGQRSRIIEAQAAIFCIAFLGVKRALRETLLIGAWLRLMRAKRSRVGYYTRALDEMLLQVEVIKMQAQRS